MRDIYIFKAQPSDHPVEDVKIHIEEEAPDWNITQQDKVFDVHAHLLENALYQSLPGGIYDRLLGKMLERKATHFRVSHTVGEKP